MEKGRIIKEIGTYIFAFVAAFVLHKILISFGEEINLVLQKFMSFEYYSRIIFFIIFGIPTLVSAFVVKKITESNWKAVVAGLVTLVLLVFWFILQGMQAALR